MTKTNVIAATTLTLLLNGCALTKGPSPHASPQEKSCHNLARTGKLAKVQDTTEKGGIAGGVAGGIVAITSRTGILNIPIVSGFGAALGAIYGRAAQENEYNKQFTQCMEGHTNDPQYNTPAHQTYDR